MYLKSLTLRGFKSFASATTLAFEPGITAIVGPNGSGKSNIVDALAWVMGEQGAKTLRGGRMDDVIFAGTSARGPLGRAEVSLTIDNSDGLLPIDYSEVTISRTLFRSGGSEYAINGSPVRLLDVQELLSDAGMGREMHVIVGQNQLDQILQATPETRRVLIEEAAGVLKHRRRKERAQRRLESTQMNLDRLADLLTEIRRQLKPLGRQAEAARKAATIQAEVRDAKARLLADDLTQAIQALDDELAAEANLARQREQAELAVQRTTQARDEAQARMAAASPRVAAAQELWYGLSGLRERTGTLLAVSAERMQRGGESARWSSGPDPDQLESEAAALRQQESRLRGEVADARRALEQAAAARRAAEEAVAQADSAYSAQLRAVAAHREGRARLTEQVASLRTRIQTMAQEIDRLRKNREEALGRAEEAERDYAGLEVQLAAATDAESGLDADYEHAQGRYEAAAAAIEDRRVQLTRLTQQQASLNARLEALRMGLQPGDGQASLLSSDTGLEGVLGQSAAMVNVEADWRTAISAALGQAADTVAMATLEDTVRALGRLRAEDLGRARVLVADAPDPDPPVSVPPGARPAMSVVQADAALRPALARLLGHVVLVVDLQQAEQVVREAPQLMAVTAAGEVLSRWFAAGGSSAAPSAIEVQAALQATQAELDQVRHDTERAHFALAEQEAQSLEMRDAVQAALARLHESDARLSALADQLGHLAQVARASRAEADRLHQAIVRSEEIREATKLELADLESRLSAEDANVQVAEPDARVRDELAQQAHTAQESHLQAQLALRTAEERLRALDGRADGLMRRVVQARQARDRAREWAAELRRQADVAAAVHAAAQWLADQTDLALAQARTNRQEMQQRLAEAEQAFAEAQQAASAATAVLDQLLQGAHRDDMTRIELQMRVNALSERALHELGLDVSALLDEYGPRVPVPVLAEAVDAAGDQDGELVQSIPYDRAEQEHRLAVAQRNLDLLGRVNPLALEEFDALSQRHAYLSEQVEDLRKTRTDLLGMIADVDARVQEVFSAAFQDVARAFADVFARLFPGGEGRLVLTDPNDVLNTGVDVEARPAGKKLKRLSLLSGGERSLVAVAFLISLFVARPSPFYILDEVEAALDDANLGRLLGIYEDLRKTSQLLLVTHQKRSMEVADALYGVTMRGDGVSRVVSQRLRPN